MFVLGAENKKGNTTSPDECSGITSHHPEGVLFQSQRMEARARGEKYRYIRV
jgi:hypothetical protein